MVLRRAVVLAAAVAAASMWVAAVGEPAAARASQDDTEPAPETSGPRTEAPVGVERAPGGGYWLTFADGTVEPVGGAPAARPADASPRRAPTAASVPRAALLGAVGRQHLRGAVVDAAASCTGSLPMDVRLGITLLPAVDWTQLAGLRDLVARGRLGGAVVLGTPDPSIAEVIAALRAVAPAGLMIAVDEEGGRVQRLRAAVGPLPAAAEQAESPPAEVERLLAAHGAAVRGLGFDTVLAPVLDVGGGPGIGDRAYGSDPVAVTAYGLAAARGLADAGLVAVVKHFPGHGRASADSHLALAVTPPWEQVAALDLEPFRAALAAGIPAVMVGHLDVPGLTDGVPASLSRAAVTGVLRTDLGFDGLVMSDALNMAAVADTWTTAEAVELALRAGVDALILGDADELDSVHAHVADAVASRRLADARLTEAAGRVLHATSTHPCAALVAVAAGV